MKLHDGCCQMNKPLMERRRRQRINDCLNQLKSILETLTHKQVAFSFSPILVIYLLYYLLYF